MPVLDVFGQNLRNLTALRGSQTSVANDLGIGRVQFQRYLRSESFPKPNLLKRICDYFGVDARILTDLLTLEQLHMLESGKQGTAVMSPRSGAINEAINFCTPDQNYFQDTSEIPDGIYQFWRGSYMFPDKAYRLLVRVHTENGARLIRGYNVRQMYQTLGGEAREHREFRGMILKQRIGFSVIFFHREPSRVVSLCYLEPVDFGYVPAAVGVILQASGASRTSRRISRCLMYRIESNYKEMLKLARTEPYVDWNDIPRAIHNYIQPQDEQF